jgi:hypothetical protein
MHAQVAAPTMEQEPAEFPFQFGLRLQRLHPQALVPQIQTPVRVG